jgi:DNA-directed RNA polymerase specialized sigma24 family protein
MEVTRLRRPSSDAECLRQTVLLLRGADRHTREIYAAYRSGCTYAEIAAHWGISKRTIKRCVARALLTIMENIEQVGADE